MNNRITHPLEEPLPVNYGRAPSTCSKTSHAQSTWSRVMGRGGAIRIVFS
jgi:hypothetical protein